MQNLPSFRVSSVSGKMRGSFSFSFPPPSPSSASATSVSDFCRNEIKPPWVTSGNTSSKNFSGNLDDSKTYSVRLGLSVWRERKWRKIRENGKVRLWEYWKRMKKKERERLSFHFISSHPPFEQIRRAYRESTDTAPFQPTIIYAHLSFLFTKLPFQNYWFAF